ncbi:MAG: hypothetical protein HQL69_14305 [Magnetococcales bacterium]|nr:hypothetical protein [Magnetococcales bacterium]
MDIERDRFNYAEYYPDSPIAVLFGGIKQTRLTVEEALTCYFEATKRTVASSTWRDYKSAVRYQLIPAF